jgi:ornithine cyclodeaminase
VAAEFGAVACSSYEDAVRGADVVCATTHSSDPVVQRAWLAAGTHVTSVGFNPDGREVDGETVRDARVVVESRAAALAPFPAGSSDLLLAIQDGLITADHIHAEIGELVLGTRPGRTDPEQITFYKSVGVAAQDAAAASLVLEAAEAR